MSTRAGRHLLASMIAAVIFGAICLVGLIVRSCEGDDPPRAEPPSTIAPYQPVANSPPPPTPTNSPPPVAPLGQSYEPSGGTHVNGYYRHDGTYVHGYTRHR